ncbi:hypothetical protein NQ318_022748 [Aromia moschata]|uniref:Uncharacterized protein n=1 Tax=Aromia moschata TaxID=1265417 RepID=A0AAV8YFG9_9CUCU|nr:hypothetical protein NQ318_022748 [Aromia moschata]
MTNASLEIKCIKFKNCVPSEHCKSSNQDKNPLCDTSYFKLSRPRERVDNMTIQCPPYRGNFCFMSTEIVDGNTITTRGCYGERDVKKQ